MIIKMIQFQIKYEYIRKKYKYFMSVFLISRMIQVNEVNEGNF